MSNNQRRGIRGRGSSGGGRNLPYNDSGTGSAGVDGRRGQPFNDRGRGGGGQSYRGRGGGGGRGPSQYSSGLGG